MAEAVYLLCAVTSLACGILLLRGYVTDAAGWYRRGREVWKSRGIDCLRVGARAKRLKQALRAARGPSPKSF